MRISCLPLYRANKGERGTGLRDEDMHINRETSTKMSDHCERANVVVSNVPLPFAVYLSSVLLFTFCHRPSLSLVPSVYHVACFALVSIGNEIPKKVREREGGRDSEQHLVVEP